jgi:hypothetical protein
LKEDSPPGKEALKERFNAFGINPGEQDIIIALKCLLIAHPKDETRKFVVENMPFKELWNIIAYSKTPLTVLREIAEHLRRPPGNADRIKVFFLLTLLCLINALFEDLRLDLLQQIKGIIEIFYEFDFFAEGRYFRRLNDLTMRFKKKAHEDEIQIIENGRRRLEQDAAAKKDIIDKPPACLKELPPTVQRKLARGGEYLEYFCTSTNNVVADEVYRYINYNNIGRFMFISAINGKLLKKLLNKDELFQNNSAIYAALCHPKCDSDFASRYAGRLNRNLLQKIVDNRNVNSSVRNSIMTRFNIKVKTF